MATWESVTDAINATAAKRSDAMLRALAEVMPELQARMAAAIGANDVYTYADLDAIIKAVEEALSQAGFYDLASAFGDAAVDYASAINKVIPISSDMANMLQVATQAKFDGWSNSVAMEPIEWLKRKMIGHSVVPVDSQALAVEMSKMLETRLKPHAGTYLETAMQTESREFIIVAEKESGTTQWEYFGALDNRTRPFCAELLANPGPYTEEEIIAMDNGQGLDVFSNAGGWNCRHGWRRARRED